MPFLEVEGIDIENIPIDQYIDWSYPDIYTMKSHIILGLSHTRAADSIRISYDGDRDGWVIEQASRFSFTVEDKECDPDWKEVAFIQAWARQDVEYEKSIWIK